MLISGAKDKQDRSAAQGGIMSMSLQGAPNNVQQLAPELAHARAQAPVQANWRTCENQRRSNDEVAALVPTC